MRQLPLELIQSICSHLEPHQRFLVATQFRWYLCQVQAYEGLGFTVVNASAKGHIELLKRMRSVLDVSKLVSHSQNAMESASLNGHVNVLTWWKNESGLPLQYSERAMVNASTNGHVNVLTWWKNESGLPLQYSERAMVNASTNGHVNVLMWWKNESGFSIQYSQKAVYYASINGHVNVLTWWKNESGLPIQYSQEAMAIYVCITVT